MTTDIGGIEEDPESQRGQETGHEFIEKISFNLQTDSPQSEERRQQGAARVAVSEDETRTDQEDRESVRSEDIFGDGESSDCETDRDGASRYRVIRHQRTRRKTKDWKLHVTERTLILGDSNLSRIGHHDYQDLQIDSFPGGTFLSVKHFMQTATYDIEPDTVILAFGINSRRNDPKATTIKQMQQAQREVRRVFPKAVIIVPMINYSNTLPKDEQTSLKLLNTHIASNCTTMELLPYSQFDTESDGVHWTRPTARAMLQHWAEVLNSNPPLQQE